MVTTRNQEKHSRANDTASMEQQPKAKQAKTDEESLVERDGKDAANDQHASGMKETKQDRNDATEEKRHETATDDDASYSSSGIEADDEGGAGDTDIPMNRAAVLTLWVSVVAERLGYSTEEAYTYGRWVAGTLAASKRRKSTDAQGRKAKRKRDADCVNVFTNMKIPVKDVDGKRLAVRASKDTVIKPEAVQHYLENKFGDNLKHAHDTMMKLAESMKADDLRNQAYELYEKFRPEWYGWGKKGTLHLDEIQEMADKQAAS